MWFILSISWLFTGFSTDLAEKRSNNGVKSGLLIGVVTVFWIIDRLLVEYKLTEKQKRLFPIKKFSKTHIIKISGKPLSKVEDYISLKQLQILKHSLELN